jgi:hypothetical protein
MYELVIPVKKNGAHDMTSIKTEKELAVFNLTLINLKTSTIKAV